jgi:hypothetical protein
MDLESKYCYFYHSWDFVPYSSSFFLLPKVSPTQFSVLQSLFKGILIFFKSPLFGFHGNCGKVCPTDSHFFGLSRSTRCGCCSYQVSSISVGRVTCYDHFCIAISTIVGTSSHILLLSFFCQKFLRHNSRRCLDQTL